MDDAAAFASKQAQGELCCDARQDNRVRVGSSRPGFGMLTEFPFATDLELT